MAKVDINTVVANVIRQNPNASQGQLQVLVRENLQDMRANGAKISPKQMAQANALIDKIAAQQAQVQFASRETKPQAKKAVRELNTQQAKTIYSNPENVEILSGKTKKTSSGKGQKVATSATKKGVVLKDSQKYLDYVTETCTGKGDLIPQPQLANKSAKASMEVFTGMKAKDFDLLEGMIDEKHQGVGTFAEHLENLEAEGRIAERDAAVAEMHNVDKTPHESSKARKQNKTAQELKSQAEHKSAAPRMNKDLRDAEYATKQGIVRHKNKKYLNHVKEVCTGEGNLIPETRLPKSAEKSFEIFESAGLIPPEAKQAASETVEQAATIGRKGAEAAVETGTKVIEKAGKFTKLGKYGAVAAVFAGIGYAISELMKGAPKADAEAQAVNIEERNSELKLSA